MKWDWLIMRSFAGYGFHLVIAIDNLTLQQFGVPEGHILYRDTESG